MARIRNQVKGILHPDINAGQFGRYNISSLYFDENGVAVSIVEKPSRPATGFWEDNGKTYYYIDDEMVVDDWVTVDGKMYYFNGNGYMVSDTTLVIDDCICVFAEDGELVSKDRLATYNGFLALNGRHTITKME